MEGIPDIEGFGQRAKARSERNWEALEKSGAFAGSLRHDSRYVEAHLHGKLTPDDVLSCTSA